MLSLYNYKVLEKEFIVLESIREERDNNDSR